jgi:osmoprotectant transport system substrate-binding protein
MHIQYFMVLNYVKYYLILFGTNEYGPAKATDALTTRVQLKKSQPRIHQPQDCVASLPLQHHPGYKSNGIKILENKPFVFKMQNFKSISLLILRDSIGGRGTMRRTATAAATAAAMLLLLALTSCAPPRGSRIVIGAKNFTEQVVLGELLAQEIEAVYTQEGHPGTQEGHPEQKVGRRFYLAGSYICQQALAGGRIDAYVEYTGTALTAILKQPLPPPGARDPAQVLSSVRALYASRYHVRVEQPLGFNDTFAMVVRGDDAEKLNLHTISDLSKLAPRWRLGVGYEFESRPDGLPGLSAAYGLHFAALRTMDLGLLYRALAERQVDIVAGNSTDGPIRALGFTVLADDKHYFPPYDAVPLVREDSIARHPEIQTAMDRLAGKVNAEEMQAMNDAVDGQHKDVAEVVRAFRARKGL